MNFQKVALDAGLYFVGVPIGTARDITLRALDVLASADVLAAEDTRSLRRLMDIHGVPVSRRPLVALHDHSKGSVIARLLSDVQAGKSVAYASEAGMPLIADPGFELSSAAPEAGVMQTCAPGPSAILTALVLGGLPTDAFYFAGFLPNTKCARRSALEAVREVPGTLVFYESPKRLAAMLSDASDILGTERLAAVCRELTKKFEDIQRGTLETLSRTYAGTTVKGELVVLIDRGRSASVSQDTVQQALEQALRQMTMRDAVDMVAKAYNLPRRQVYQQALALTKEG
ncbi:16S rRNA (cytidine(1402)-2'-O)-methyltransferase [uncultured Roseobacter sp.]|uniref:16S rRNA (cytidine(1402)-2'-O)-methyltransferase n=1 Tax=uncultured Roseobacter sp. TaxID=114847 RepID=UPI00263889B0|nr:16S rRNA (cytidine(1402)-2'-O)-methyltransferase [uncultured Roseobacter sp.]